ncbi:MAG: hypothetical protein HZA17_06900 [Nitrospirae bacterium]|nr:hypothetical protein [Nitrospirota bacterium]
MSQLATAVQTVQRIEQRIEERIPIIGNFLLFRESGLDDNNINIEGVTSNVSRSGACVVTSRRLRKGIIYTVVGKALGDVPRNARIMWCRKIDKEIFGVGISLSRASSDR